MNERESAKLNEGRMLRVALPVLLPLLQKRKDAAMGRLQSEFKLGKSDYTALVAELVVLSDIESDILRQNKELEHIEEKHYGK